MATTTRTTALQEIREKVVAGERLDLDDGITLLESHDILELGELADLARRNRGGTDEVFFVNNLYLNYTTICRVKCKFCAFARTSKQADAVMWDIPDLVAHAQRVREDQEFTEIHMVGGENPHLDFSYYTDITRALAPRVRKIIAPGKEPGAQWLETHRIAHGLGLKTHCTMLYNHVETYEERIEHLLALRDLQDETGGFMAFIPLPFHPQNTVFERRGWKFSTGQDDLKMLAVSRLMLDNIEHVKAYWIMISTPLAQVGLSFGANDIQGTVVEEKIAHAAGAVTPTEEKIADLVRVIQEAGKIPVQRDTFYNELRRWDP
jgi:aminodeoxyfutalosine synthase